MSIMLPSGISLRIREDLIDGASRTQTTLIIDPIVTMSGHRVTMADIGDKGFGKIDQGNSSEELMSWTGIIDNTNTYTLTGCIWGINFHNLDSDVDNRKRHTSGNKFSINTDMHFIAEQFVSKDDFDVKDNTIGWGDGADSDKRIEARNGDTNKPYMEYNKDLNKWIISNDGINSFDPSAGGSGLVAGHGIDINAGAIDVDLTELTTDTALDTTGGQLSVKHDTTTLIKKGANGLYNDLIQGASQTSGYLVGGNNPSAISAFKSIGYGANNGKVKINVDGTNYDNLDINLSENPGAESALIGSSLNNSWQNFTGFSFTVSTGMYLTRISLTQLNGSYSGVTVNIRQGQSMSGTVLVTKTGVNWLTGFGANDNSCIFSTPIWLDAGVYTVELGANVIMAYASSPAYTGWAGYVSSSFNSAITPAGKIWGYTATPLTTEIIRANIQSAIRTATSKTETVIYDTNHFKITSSTASRSSQVLKLMAPSTGTNISEMLDLGVNATETLGTGDENRIVKTDGSGKISNSLISGKDVNIFSFSTGANTTAVGSALNTVYQNTSARPRLINVSVRLQNTNGVQESTTVQIGITSNPTTAVNSGSSFGFNYGYNLPFSFIVPAGWYYRIAASGGDSYGTPSIASWFECDLI